MKSKIIEIYNRIRNLSIIVKAVHGFATIMFITLLVMLVKPETGVYPVIVALVLGTAVGWYSYRVYMKRIKEIIDFMRKVEQGDFKTRLEITSHDEIGQICESLNEMSSELNEYVDRVYNAEVQRKNAEMNALQMQINPHFLYNTLESIKAKVVINNDEESARMISILGNMFRWISRTSEKAIPLDEELEYIKNYMELQSYRYDMQMEICQDVPDELLDCLVPKLILQPVVENVVKHALDSDNREKIFGITVNDEDPEIIITVYDNGNGMEAAKVEEMNTKLSEWTDQDDFDSIGLQNVNQRIKLMYGNEYGVQIKSMKGFGTAVKIKLPKEM